MDGDTLDVDDVVVKDEASNALSCRLIRIIMAAVIISGEVEKLMFQCLLLVGGVLFCENYEMNGEQQLPTILVVMLLFVVSALISVMWSGELMMPRPHRTAPAQMLEQL